MSKKKEGRDVGERIAESLECICHEFRKLNHFLRAAQGFQISQSIGGINVAITGIVKGATGTFTETPTPPGGQLQAGNIPSWSVDDTLITLTPSADGTSVSAATQTTDPAASFNLTVTGISSSGATITATANVPLIAPVVPATGFDIEQTS
jgi:hypothetical protein